MLILTTWCSTYNDLPLSFPELTWDNLDDNQALPVRQERGGMVGWRHPATPTSWRGSAGWREWSRTRQGLFVLPHYVGLQSTNWKVKNIFKLNINISALILILSGRHCSGVSRVQMELYLKIFYKHPDLKCQTLQNEPNCLSCPTLQTLSLLLLAVFI